MYVFAWIWELIRELAIVAAAVGIAKWAWDQHRLSGERHDGQARQAMEEARARTELKAYQDTMLAQARAAEERQRLKVHIHRLLHASSEPFVSFEEIRQRLASDGGSQPVPDPEIVRQCLMELVAERCIAQIEHDRYFVGADFEADDIADEMPPAATGHDQRRAQP